MWEISIPYQKFRHGKIFCSIFILKKSPPNSWSYFQCLFSELHKIGFVVKVLSPSWLLQPVLKEFNRLKYVKMDEYAKKNQKSITFSRKSIFLEKVSQSTPCFHSIFRKFMKFRSTVQKSMAQTAVLLMKWDESHIIYWKSMGWKYKIWKYYVDSKTNENIKM